MRTTRSACFLAATVMTVALGVFGVARGAGAAGDEAADRLSLLPGRAGCLSTFEPRCTRARGEFSFRVAVARDGRHIYVASTNFSSSTIEVLKRDPRTSRLAAMALPGACLNRSGSNGCARAPLHVDVTDIELAPDGRQLYVATTTGPGGAHNVLTLSVSARNGTLAVRPGPSGCVAAPHVEGCGDAHALGEDTPKDAWYFYADDTRLAISPDGRHLYVSSGDGIAVFARDGRTGALVQAAGPSGCIRRFGRGDCTTGLSSFSANAIALSPDGRHLYVAGGVGGCNEDFGCWSTGLFVLARDPTTGGLTPLPAGTGCLRPSASDGCSAARRIASVVDVAVSHDGRNVYATGNGVAAFTRDSRTGALSQLAGHDACLTATPIPRCRRFRGGSYFPGSGMAIADDGRTVYVTAGSYDATNAANQSLVLLARDRSGALRQLSGRAGCVSPRRRHRCTLGRGLGATYDVLITPDGRSVLEVGTRAIAVFRRR